MTVLSVNVNKIALLRNSRGRDFPSVLGFIEQVLALGVKGITVHPRPDERHVTRQDVYDISALLQDYPDVEFNIEGYPSENFMQLVLEVAPAQVTLVPDHPDQLTSDHGWDIAANSAELKPLLARLRAVGIRSSLFLDPDASLVELLPSVMADRIELYTEDYASHFGSAAEDEVFERYQLAAAKAVELGIGINAGHDLDLQNLPKFLSLPQIAEVSIGHALVVECLQQGLRSVIEQYLAITGG
jgi:pyridoxine 5-phosphate synthase